MNLIERYTTKINGDVSGYSGSNPNDRAAHYQTASGSNQSNQEVVTMTNEQFLDATRLAKFHSLMTRYGKLHDEGRAIRMKPLNSWQKHYRYARLNLKRSWTKSSKRYLGNGLKLNIATITGTPVIPYHSLKSG